MSESERNPDHIEQLPIADRISTVLSTWLTGEIESSMDNQNAYLDSIDTFVATGTEKTKSHYNRLLKWTEQFEDIERDPSSRPEERDLALAHQIYGAMTGLSGAYRTQCFILAYPSQQDYVRRRTEAPLGVAIGQHVQRRLAADKDISLENLVSHTHAVNDRRLDKMQKIHGAKRLKSLGNFVRLYGLQEAWLDLATDMVLYGAQQREGSLTNVPMLEPRRITDAKLYLPFK